MNVEILSEQDLPIPGSVLRVQTTSIIQNDMEFIEAFGDDFDPLDLDDLSLDFVLVDQNNFMILEGSPDTYDLVEVNDGFRINISTIITLPSDLDIVEVQTYFLRFCIGDNERTISRCFSQPLEIYAQQEVEFGILDSISGFEIAVPLKGVVELDTIQDVDIQIFDPENVEISGITITPTSAGSGRYNLVSSFETGNLWFFVNGSDQGIIVHNPIINDNLTYTTNGNIVGYDPENSHQIFAIPSLDPYIAVWKTSTTLIGTTSHWIFNHIIADALKELFASIERGTRFTGLSESMISNEDGMRFLKMGRDLFNGLERPSNFTMIGANGTMRRMWLLCASYEALFSRQLEEGIKQFDFSGQSTSLSVDISQAYDLAKSNVESQIEQVVKPYKRKLAIKGINGGSGSDQSIANGKVQTSLGLTYSQVGNAGYNFNGTNSRFFSTRRIFF